MPLDAKQQILYKPASRYAHAHYQADPPVCTHCLVEITQASFGWAYFTTDKQTGHEWETIECTNCTPIRESGTSLRQFLERHQLLCHHPGTINLVF